MKIFAHTIIHNEENFIWYAISSVIDYVDKILVWDTGSSDESVRIVNELIKKFPDKISFKEVGEVDSEKLTIMRQKMLEESDCDWIVILDGDEIWSSEAIKEVIDVIKGRGRELDAIVAPFYNLVGDIFHHQNEKSGRYKIKDRIGHLQVKAINRKIPGLHVNNPYPLEGFFNDKKKLVQESEKIYFTSVPYLHLTHLKRSGKDRRFDKFKVEIGDKFPKDFKFPEVLYQDAPIFVPSPWNKIGGLKLLAAKSITVLRKIKRGAYGLR